MNKIAEAFSQVATAASAAEIERILKSNRYLSSLRWVSVGNDKGIENNKGPIETVSEPAGAIFEKIMNGKDAEVALWQQENRFQTSPRTPAQALEEIARNAGESVYVLLSQPRGDAKDTLNVSIIDGGTGILPEKFPTTIMSLAGSNKSTNPLLAGKYGMGGSAIYAYAPYTLVYSRSATDPNKIGFTVVKRGHWKDDWKHTCYVYLTDREGQVPWFELDHLMILMLAPDQINPKALPTPFNASFTELLATMAVMPEHGTVVRSFNVEKLANKAGILHRLREKAFGLQSVCKMISGASETSKQAISTITGLRHILRQEWKAGSKSGKKSSKPILYHEPPAQIMDGEATFELWVLGQTENGKAPVAALGSISDTNCVFVTMNAQSHAQLSIRRTLEKLKLHALSERMVVEINCDTMTPQTQSGSFLSTREGLTADCVERISNALRNYLECLSDEGGVLRKLNDDLYREAIMEQKAPMLQETARRVLETMRSVALNKFLGLVKVPYFSGASMRDGSGASQSGDGQGGGEVAAKIERENKTVARKVVTTMKPTRIEIRTSELKVGADQYVVVNTDAADVYDQGLYLTEWPSWMTPRGEIGLVNGRKMFNVTVSKVREGTRGVITAELDLEPFINQAARAHLGITDRYLRHSIEVTVVSDRAKDGQAKKNDGKSKPPQEPAIPECQPRFVSRKDANFYTVIKPPRDTDLARVAGRYDVSEDYGRVSKIDVWLHKDFDLLVKFRKDIEQRDGAMAAEEFEQRYLSSAMYYTMLHVMDYPPGEEGRPSDEDMHKAFAIAMRMALLNQWETYLKGKNRKRLAA